MTGRVGWVMVVTVGQNATPIITRDTTLWCQAIGYNITFVILVMHAFLKKILIFFLGLPLLVEKSLYPF